MGKRWAAGAFLALALLWAVSALPAARGQETSPAASPLKTAGEAESGEVLAVEALEEPEDSLEDLRTIEGREYWFIINLTGTPKSAPESFKGETDILTGKPVGELQGFDTVIVRR